MLVVALVASKGGVGKSTDAVNLATIATASGSSVIIDLDPQESAVAWSTIRGDREPKAVAGLPDTLPRMLEVARAGAADFVFIDTQGHADRPGVIAARHADLVLVPCRTSAVDVLAMRDTVALLRHADALDKAVAILFAPSARSREVAEAEAALHALGLPALHPPVVDRKEYRDAFRDGLAVTESAPRGPAAEEMRALWQAILARAKKVTKAAKKEARNVG